MSRTDIECPGDIVPYNCFIVSNSETVHLTWTITIPEQEPLNITYSNATSNTGSIDHLGDYVTTSLLRYTSDEYIESSLMLFVPGNVFLLNSTKVECTISNLDDDSSYVFINSAGMSIKLFKYVRIDSPNVLVPLMPSNFKSIEEFHESNYSTLTFSWDPPQGSGPEAVVEYYVVSFSPAPVSHSVANMVQSSPWNVTLAHNIVYRINVTAVNCAGESDILVTADTEISKEVKESGECTGRVLWVLKNPLSTRRSTEKLAVQQHKANE